MNLSFTAMKTKHKIPSGKLLVAISIVLLLFNSCKSKTGCTDVTASNYDSSDQKDDGSCVYLGVISFWKLASYSLSAVNVTINGNTSQATSNFSSAQNCTTARGCAVFSLPAGTYSFTADETTGLHNHWSGSISISAKGCNLYKLQ